MNERKDRIRVHIDSKQYTVIGGNFREMLAAIKQISGRRFIGELKVWELPGKFEDIRHQLDISGYVIEGGTAVTASSRTQAKPSTRSDRIRIVVDGYSLAIIGGSFQDMLAVVKELPGRFFDGESKIWEIPGHPATIKKQVEEAGFQLEGAENIPPPPPEKAPQNDNISPPAFVPSDWDSPPPFIPPDWDTDSPPDDISTPEQPAWFDDKAALPPLEDNSYIEESNPINERSPFEAEQPIFTSKPKTAVSYDNDKIRFQRDGTYFIMSGGNFRNMLKTIKDIPGRTFNGQEKIWDIPEQVELDKLQQIITQAGFTVEIETE